MTDLAPFDVYFVDRFPSEAARVLEGFAPVDVAAALGGPALRMVPAAIGNVLAEMEPTLAAQTLEHMPKQAISQAFGELDDATVTGLIRGSSAAKRKALLDCLPESRATVIDKRLRYASGTVGAWLESVGWTFSAGTQVSTCLTRLRKAQGAAQALIILTEANGHFAGVVPLTKLVAADDKMRLRDLIDDHIRPLRLNMPIDAAADNQAWRDYNALPVIDADGEIVGELTLDRLEQALSGAPALDSLPPPASIFANLGHACLLSVRGLSSLAEPPRFRPTTDSRGDKDA